MSDERYEHGDEDAYPDEPITADVDESAETDAAEDAEAGEGGVEESLPSDGDAPAGPLVVTSEEAVATAFPQHWTMMFCCLSIFVACIFLPIEGRRNDLYASHSIAGGFLTIFAAYGIYAQHANIKFRRMIVWPALFMALDGLFVGVRRLWQLIENVREMPNPTKNDWVRMGGPGLWVILFCSFLVFWTLMRGAAAGRKKDLERKEMARAARGSRRQ